MFRCVILSIAVHAAVLGVSGLGIFSLEYERKEIPVVLHYDAPKRLLPHIRKVRNRQQLVNNPKATARRNSPLSELSKLNPPAKNETTVSGMDHREAFLRYQDVIKQRIEEVRRYPYSAKKNRLEGVVCVRFVLLSDGRVKDILLLKSSGYPVLDRSAIKTVKIACPFPPIPENFSERYLLFEVALVYELK